MAWTRRTLHGTLLACVLFAGAWQAAGDDCHTANGARCGMVSVLIAASEQALFTPAMAESETLPRTLHGQIALRGGTSASPTAQLASFVLLGAALALAAQTFKRRKTA